MNTTVNPIQSKVDSPLARARELALPSREAMLKRSPLVKRFWESNASLLEEAWAAWENENEVEAALLESTLLAPELKVAVEKAWAEPTNENIVNDLWTEVSDGVYQAQFFDPDKLSVLRDYFDVASSAGIPTRPPYGIALNRNGAMLDPRSEGYLAAPAFQSFYDVLMDRYMRPIARLLFPEILGYDGQTFGFSIQYRPGVDTYLQPHTDASSVTLNVNMNKPDESYTGSEVDFYNRTSGEASRISFEPGTALIHRGNVPHTAHPITSGVRSNMVLWLFGDRMQLPSDHSTDRDVEARQRWTHVSGEKDRFAPF